jgi:uncharacterized BrkB/YihY/UPF0761 family membrane protein
LALALWVYLLAVLILMGAEFAAALQFKESSVVEPKDYFD